MTVSNLLEIVKKLRSGQGKEIDLSSLGNYLEQRTAEAQSAVLEKISEKDFCTVMGLIQTTVLAAMVLDGQGLGLITESKYGDLDGFTHTISLAILGIAMDEEWL